MGIKSCDTQPFLNELLLEIEEIEFLRQIWTYYSTHDALHLQVNYNFKKLMN